LKNTNAGGKTTMTKYQTEAGHNKIKNSRPYTWVNICGVYTAVTNTGYMLYLAKMGSQWFLSADEHHHDDIDDNGFKTLAEAKEYAQEWGDFYDDCVSECIRIHDPAGEWQIYESQPMWIRELWDCFLWGLYDRKKGPITTRFCYELSEPAIKL
jgi:hypothetical protein